jgi:hypothetical protein
VTPPQSVVVAAASRGAKGAAAPAAGVPAVAVPAAAVPAASPSTDRSDPSTQEDVP